MKINFLGDSITEGVGASNIESCYVNQVAKILNCDVNNYGISGTRIARQKKPSSPLSFDLDFQLRAEIIDETADLTVVFGGVNDFSHGDAELGDLNNNSPYTFCGGLRNLIETLKRRKLEVLFVLPLGMMGDDKPSGEGSQKSNSLMCDYIDKMKLILKEYNVEYLDLYHFLPLPNKDGGNDYFIDFVHPNDLGHLLLAEKIVEKIKHIDNKKAV